MELEEFVKNNLSEAINNLAKWIQINSIDDSMHGKENKPCRAHIGNGE